MGLLATPPGTEEVKAREFDLTQTAKKLAATIPVFATAIIGVLRAAGVEKATEPAYIAAVLGLTAFGVVALGLVAAADILGRSYVEGAQRIGDATALPGGDDAARERQQLDQAAKAQRDELDRAAAVERERKDGVAADERDRLARVAEDERTRSGKVAEDERNRLDREAEDERKRKDQLAEDERDRLARRAEDERHRLDREAEDQRKRKDQGGG